MSQYRRHLCPGNLIEGISHRSSIWRLFSSHHYICSWPAKQAQEDCNLSGSVGRKSRNKLRADIETNSRNPQQSLYVSLLALMKRELLRIISMSWQHFCWFKQGPSAVEPAWVADEAPKWWHPSRQRMACLLN